MEQPIYNPTIPYTGIIPGGFGVGRMVRIQGSIPLHANKFSINLVCGPHSHRDDIGLHLSTRFHENVVVRNSQINSTWGTEERQGHLPLAKGQNFEIIILCEMYQYKIAFNGHHFADFGVRLPIERVTNLYIDGTVNVSLIQYEFQPISNFPSAPMAPPQPMIPGPNSYNPTCPGQPVGWAPPPPSYIPPPGQYPPPPPQPYNYGNYQQPTPPGPYVQPTGAYPAPPQEYGGYSGQQQQHKGNPMNSAMKQVAGVLDKVGLGSVVKKIPGVGKTQGKWT